MGEGSDAQKFSTWLGIAMSLIAVLAFFGVTSFEDLKNGGDSARSEACAMGVAASDDLGVSVEPADYDLYAQRLLEAVEATEDQELRGSLREAAYAHQAYGAALRAEEGSRTTALLPTVHTTQRKWTSLCGVPPSKWD
ncbi:hypothetical protein [Streptomyces scopuliridis]|uniref:hypothetical protein n=1 Tax=Streptomyces scopuliridis TaxID=452529 RepID=UPI00368D489E